MKRIKRDKPKMSNEDVLKKAREARSIKLLEHKLRNANERIKGLELRNGDLERMLDQGRERIRQLTLSKNKASTVNVKMLEERVKLYESEFNTLLDFDSHFAHFILGKLLEASSLGELKIDKKVMVHVQKVLGI